MLAIKKNIGTWAVNSTIRMPPGNIPLATYKGMHSTNTPIRIPWLFINNLVTGYQNGAKFVSLIRIIPIFETKKQ